MIGVPYNDPNTPPFELSINPINNASIATRNTMHAHGEGPSSHVLECQLIIFRLMIAREHM